MYISKYAYLYLSVKYRMDTVFYLMSPIVYLLNIEGMIINNEIGYGLWPRRN